MIIKFLKGFLDLVVPKEIEEERIRSITSQLEYVPNELIHHIQSLLPEKDAARTCVLSKSWLHIWSTIPTLRFTMCATDEHLTKVEEIDYIKLIDRTLLRYLNDNLSIECLHLHLHLHDSSLSSLAEKWFQSLASRNCLKELSLTICTMYTLTRLTIPGEILSCINLNTISLKCDNFTRVMVNVNPVIKCSCLRVLELVNVCISSEEAFHNLLCSCSLLKKINIFFQQDFKTIKVKNLRRLGELSIRAVQPYIHDILELYDVPSLCVFHYYTTQKYTFKMDSLVGMRKLVIMCRVVDAAFTDMINSKFPFLESLTLTMLGCRLETIDITCDSLKRLTLKFCERKQIRIHVYASKLLYFSYDGLTVPSLLFPSSTPERITLILNFNPSNSIDLPFFLKLREALSLTSNFEIEIKNIYSHVPPLNINVDDIKRRVMFPSRNVQQLSFKQTADERMWTHSTIFDLFFSICYPRFVKVYYIERINNYMYKQTARKMMEKKRPELKDVRIRNSSNGKWETLTSFHDESSNYNTDEFKLDWFSERNSLLLALS
ncbi:F-box protein-like protein [Tanacetum coccineum]